METDVTRGGQTAPDLDAPAGAPTKESGDAGADGNATSATPVIADISDSSGISVTDATDVTLLRVAAAASLIAGLIHFAAVPEHRAEWLLAALFFTALAAFEIVWAAWAWCDDRPSMLWLGVLVNLGTVALWAVSRSSGLPFGPEAGEPEDMGTLDLACTSAEVVAVVVLGLLLLQRARKNRFGTA